MTKSTTILTSANEVNLATKVIFETLVVNSTVLLETAIALCEGKTGQNRTRLLLGCGSQRTFVTKDLSAKF